MTGTLKTHAMPALGGPARAAVTRVKPKRSNRSMIMPIVWMALLAAFVITLGALPTARDRVPSGATSTIAVRVSQSDTLWSIAASHRLPGTSTARMVELISAANALPQGSLRAGAVVRVPVEVMTDATYAQAGAPTTAY